MDIELLSLLSDGRFRSGEELGAYFGVSRATISNRLARISQTTGLAIQRVSGKGYRLSRPVSLLRGDEIEQALGLLGWRFRLLSQIDSTSAECRRQLPLLANEPVVVMAEHQSEGRGRRGRAWVSSAFENVTASLLLRVPAGLKDLPATSLIVSLAISDALKGLGYEDVALKWPNDVYLSGRKVAGVLLELSGDPTGECFLIVGIGLNVNQHIDAEKIDQPWTSLCESAGGLQDRTRISIGLFKQLDAYLAMFFKHGFVFFKDAWDSQLLWRGERCSLVAGQSGIAGVVLGVADDGALRLDVAGREQRYCAGELSLRIAQ